MSNSIFIHDYETFGTDAKVDRVSQFAGIRTDEDFNIIEDPVNFYCQPSDDFLPNPEACLVTGVTPTMAYEQGIPEHQFFERVQKELARPQTCGMGYNSVNFDDEFTRFGFYRNFHDPYIREWKNGNSRWDLIDVLRIIHAAQPDAFNVPPDEDGKPSFRLENLTKANGIEHENAHDALADVVSTIEMAKLVKKNAPEMFNRLYEQRQKRAIQPIVDSGKPFMMAAPFFGHENHYVEMLYPVGKSNKNKNEYYCVKLNHENVNDLKNKSAEEINDIVFSKNNEKSMPIHKIQINKCPAILPPDYFRENAKNLGLDGNLCRKNRELVDSMKGIGEKIETVFNMKEFETYTDVDQMLYSGFFGKMDKADMEDLQQTPMDQLTSFKFHNGCDERLPELLFRYIGRNAPDVFDSQKRAEWDNYCHQRLTNPDYNASITKDEYFERIETLRNNDEFQSDEKEALLDDLQHYGETLLAKFEPVTNPSNNHRSKERFKP